LAAAGQVTKKYHLTDLMGFAKKVKNNKWRNK